MASQRVRNNWVTFTFTVSPGNLPCKEGTEKQENYNAIHPFTKMSPKKIKHLVYGFSALKLSMYIHTHKYTHTHTHTHPSSVKSAQSLPIFLFNTLGKMMLMMLNIFQNLENTWNNTQSSAYGFIFSVFNFDFKLELGKVVQNSKINKEGQVNTNTQ